jgi:hypothetical protein
MLYQDPTLGLPCCTSACPYRGWAISELREAGHQEPSRRCLLEEVFVEEAIAAGFADAPGFFVPRSVAPGSWLLCAQR